MARWLALLILLVLAPPARAQRFDRFLARYQAADSAGRERLARSFVAEQRARGFPIVEDGGRVVFLYLAEHGEREVRVVGDFASQSAFTTAWDTAGAPMTRAGSLFFRRMTVEPDARLDYRLVVDGRGVVDPLNPRTLFSGPGGGEASELVMPGHVLPAEAVERPGVPRGTLRVVDEPWASPRVTIYLPPGYTPTASYPTVYTADGSAWIRYVGLPTILDNLIAGGEVQPVIAVMVDPAPDRASWHLYNPEYLAYLRRVVGYVDTHYATRPRASERLHAGTSSGGRASLFAALEAPELFGNAALLSPSLSGPAYYLEPYFSGSRTPPPGLRVWISSGSYEGSIDRDARVMERYFTRAGVPVRAVYSHQGHSFGAWKEAAGPMLRYFFPAAGARPAP